MKALLDEYENPTHASSRDLQDAIAPVCDLVMKEQLQIVTMKALLAQAEMEDHDSAYDGKLEHLHQTLAAHEREVNAAATHLRNAAHSRRQLDRYMADFKSDIAVMAAMRAEKA